MSKRIASDSEKGPSTGGGSGAGGPPNKRNKSSLEQPRYSVSTLEDLDMNILRFQNKKLTERLIIRQKAEHDLRSRLEHLETKQTSTEAIVYVISRYWNQLNEDLRVILQRFDAETSDEQENKNENEATTSFLAQLATWDKEELEESLQQRVESSTRAVGKVVQAFDRIVQRNAKITTALKGDTGDDEETCRPSLEDAVKQANAELQKNNASLNALVTSLHQKHHDISLKFAESKDKVEALETLNDENKNRMDDIEYELNRTRSREHRLEEQLQEAREKLRDLQNSGGEPSESGPSSGAPSAAGKPGKFRDNVSQAKLDEIHKELEEQKELATNRLSELEGLNTQHKETLKLVEKLRMDLQYLPENIVVETAEYKCLQSHFSVLYNESMQLKTFLEDSRAQIQTSKNNHLRQIEHMESEELSMQKRLRTEVIQLEDNLAQVRREYEMLRLEFEQTLAANEQTGPINREMRHLITSLQNHNQQLKGEMQRYKKRLKESNHEIGKLKHQLDQSHSNLNAAMNANNPLHKVEVKLEPGKESVPPEGGLAAVVDDPNNKQKEEVKSEEKKEPDLLISTSEASATSNAAKKEEGHSATLGTSTTTITPVSHQQGHHHLPANAHPHHPHPPPSHSGGNRSHHPVRREGEEAGEGHSLQTGRNIDPEIIIRDLRNQLKKANEQYKEMKLLYDMMKGAPKDIRDKAQIMAAEKKYRLEVEELRKQVAKQQLQQQQEQGEGRTGRDRRKLSDEEAARKVGKLEDMVNQLQKQLQAQKQEDEALLNEMEVTGSAFEDMQEQNLRLIQQLREKDDANFKLMSERIKSQQIQKLLKEEKESLQEQVIALQAQVEAQNQVVRKLEEKERLLQNNLSTIEKELSLKQQAMELHKRKAIESTQSSADLKLHLEKYLTQLKEAQSTVADKTSALQESAFKTTRLQEEAVQFKRKYERAKKFELASTADEVLLEEIREYKEQLTCPSCKTRRKDAVLTKCFHVFCYDCLKTRYELRQRKCPKCVQGFGANDFHRLYLA